MSEYLPGAIVLVDFPFANLLKTKKRPALVISRPDYGDYILSQITSKEKKTGSVRIEEEDLQWGSMKQTSYVRYQVLFTSSESLIDRQVTLLTTEKTISIFDQIGEIVTEAISYRLEKEGGSQ